MSNVIAFIERMGRDAQLRDASSAEMERALVDAQIDPGFQTAILGKDQPQLEALLGREPLCCLMFPVKEGDEESEEAPSRDDEEISSMRSFRAMGSVG